MKFLQVKVEGLGLIEAGLMDLTLTFRSSGDDRDRGKVAFYEFRSSPEPITSLAQWFGARTLKAKFLDLLTSLCKQP